MEVPTLHSSEILKNQSSIATITKEVHNKEFMSCYLTTLKLRKTQERRTERTDESSPSNPDLSAHPISRVPGQSNFTKKVLSGYMVTLTLLRETAYNSIIYKSGPSTLIPNLPIPSLEQSLVRTNQIYRQDPSRDPKLNQEPKEVTVVQSEIVPAGQIPDKISQSLPISVQQPGSSAFSTQEIIKQAENLQKKKPWAKFSIYRVPKIMREVDEKLYVPQMVSIGPYHHGKKELADMETHKWRAMHQVCKRTGHDMKRYIAEIWPLENWAWSSYEGEIEMSRYEFVHCLVLLHIPFVYTSIVCNWNLNQFCTTAIHGLNLPCNTINSRCLMAFLYWSYSWVLSRKKFSFSSVTPIMIPSSLHAA